MDVGERVVLLRTIQHESGSTLEVGQAGIVIGHRGKKELVDFGVDLYGELVIAEVLPTAVRLYDARSPGGKAR